MLKAATVEPWEEAQPALLDDVHAFLADPIVTVGNRLEAAEPPDIKVREEAGGKGRLRLDQGHVDGAGGVLVNMACDRAAAWTTPNDDKLRFSLTVGARREQRRGKRCTRRRRRVA